MSPDSAHLLAYVGEPVVTCHVWVMFDGYAELLAALAARGVVALQRAQ